VIELHDLSFSYQTPKGDIPVLQGVDLAFREGESVSLIGANGSGKTTLIRCLNGLLRPSDGDVRVDGLSVRDSSQIHEIRRCVGMVFQNPDDQIVSAQVEREVAFGLENLGVPSEEMHGRVRDVLDRFSLDRYRVHPPHLLSGGERQRLAIASVLAMRPRYLLLDEPTALLDPGSRGLLLHLLDELHRSGEITPILVTQNPSEAARSDRVIAMDGGRVALDGPPEEVFPQADTLGRMGLGLPAAADVAARIGLGPPLPLSPEALAERLRGTRDGSPDRDVRRSSPAATGTAIIEARGLRHVYNPGLPTETIGLHGLDLEVASGSLVSLIGPSGSGKSTFAQHLNGLLEATEGELTVCGVSVPDTKDLRDLRRRVGLIFQFPEAQLFADTVYEDVAFGPRNLGMEGVDERVRQALADVGLIPERFLSRSPFGVSGGEKRRVAIAGVLAMRPDILILDEPSAGLDPSGTREIEGLLARLEAEGTTVLLISHDMDCVAHLSDRVVALESGRLTFDESPAGAFADRDRLLRLSLDVPEAVKVADAVRMRGIGVPMEALTVEAVARSLTR
jgi:energy-coupling factor transport system ATP-binding protein